MVWHKYIQLVCVNPSPSGKNDRLFKNDLCIFMNEKFYNLINILLKFVRKCLVDNKSALVEFMAWRRTGYKPLSEPMPTQPIIANMRLKGEMSFNNQLHNWNNCGIALLKKLFFQFPLLIHYGIWLESSHLHWLLMLIPKEQWMNSFELQKWLSIQGD